MAIGRKQFLRLGGGLAVAAGLVVTGDTPAFAERARKSAASRATAHKNNLPERYDDVVKYSMPYRKAIYGAQTPKVRSDLWTTHLTRYRGGRPNLTSDQARVLDRVIRFAGDEKMFGAGPSGTTGRQLHSLQAAATSAFGRGDTGRIFATLGPPQAGASPATDVHPDTVDCECSGSSDYCSTKCVQAYPPCNIQFLSCGFLYEYNCDGVCDV